MKKFLLFFFFLSASTCTLIAQIYTVPGAQQQPAWVFPLWFEDGSGAKDTLYFSYDEAADILGDSVFGSLPEIIDTVSFQVYYGCAISPDHKAKKKITLSWPELWVNICFLNTQMPVTVHWDSKVFRDDSLPFPDQSPAPRGQGVLAFDLPMGVNMCSFEQPLLLTDTTVYPWDTVCSFNDSIVFEGTSASYLSFHVQPWTGILSGLDNPWPHQEDFYMLPNPVNDELHVITKNYKREMTLMLIDAIGNIRVNMKLISNDFRVKVDDLQAGCYLAIILDQQTKQIQNEIIIIKQ